MLLKSKNTQQEHPLAIDKTQQDTQQNIKNQQENSNTKTTLP